VSAPAIAVACSEIALAIGKRSLPPLVPGNLLPVDLQADKVRIHGLVLRASKRPKRDAKRLPVDKFSNNYKAAVWLTNR